MSVTHNKTRPASDFLLLTIGLVAVATVLFFTFASGVSLSPDRQIDALAKDVIQRVPIALFLLVLCLTTDLKSGLRFTVTPAVRLFALVPCLLVALANFPFSALLGGGATVQKNQYVWLFCLQCLLIGVIEELFFRLIVWRFVDEKMRGKHVVWRIVVCSAVFALWHLVNLFFGQGFATTMLQVGYSFLVGAMLSTLYLVTNNIWWCVLVHALFDVGGKLVATLGSGNVWDVPFWIATAVCGTLCAVWAVFTLVACGKNEAANGGLSAENIETQNTENENNQVQNK